MHNSQFLHSWYAHTFKKSDSLFIWFVKIGLHEPPVFLKRLDAKCKTIQIKAEQLRLQEHKVIKYTNYKN